MRNKEGEISGHEIERALSEEVRECRERESSGRESRAKRGKKWQERELIEQRERVR